MSKYYITTTLPYVNADPHIGFALEIVQADMLARYARLMGQEVVFNTGTDEHGLKIWKNAQDAGLDPKTYCDGFAAKFHGLKDLLNLSYTNFVRTTDAHHIAAAQEFWRRCDAKGDIYKKAYKVKYCVGCELEKTDSELVDGCCPIHPKMEIEIIEEENYFFRWSKYGEALLAYYSSHPEFVMPESRLNEIRSFVEGGLQDFSISRLKSKLPWGVPVPDDSEQVMYVWFDALVNYISTIGWPEDEASFSAAWPGVQVAGKDNLRQQSAMWQAMLLSADLPMSRQVFIHGFITSEGQKMSKSLGNVVNPQELVQTYGVDPVRHYLLGALPAYADGDFSRKLFEEHYGSKLVNGVGNLASRVGTMVGKYCEAKAPAAAPDIFDTARFWETYDDAVRRYHFDDAIKAIDELVGACNKEIDVQAPFKKAKEGIDVSPLMYQLSEALRHIGMALLPVAPESAGKLLGNLSVDADAVSFEKDRVWGGLVPGTSVLKGEILFPRLESATIKS